MVGKNRTCIWCGRKPEYRCLIQRVRETSFRYSVRFELCDLHAADVIHQLGRLLEYPDDYLYRELIPRSVPKPLEETA